MSRKIASATDPTSSLPLPLGEDASRGYCTNNDFGSTATIIRSYLANPGESGIGLACLHERIKSASGPRNIHCLLPIIDTALAHPLDTLMELQDEQLNARLGRLFEDLGKIDVNLNASKIVEGALGLQRLREEIRAGKSGRISKATLLCISDAIGKSDLPFHRKHPPAKAA